MSTTRTCGGRRALLPVALICVSCAAVFAAGASAAVGKTVGPERPATTAVGDVVVPAGQPVELAVALDRSTDIGAPLTPGIENAIRLAVSLQPRIRGFRVRLDDYNAPCGDPNEVAAADAAASRAIVADLQTAAVIGAMCSAAFGGGAGPDGAGGCTTPLQPNALAILEAAGIPAINGSTTDPCLSLLGATVFDATVVPDPDFGAWYAQVSALPIDQLWRTAYAAIYGSPPTDYADLYFDATTLLLTRLRQVSHLDGGSLAIDRSALSSALRNTTGFPGVTCAVTIDPSTGFRVLDQSALQRCTRA